MNLDITFCDPKGCAIKETCSRWVKVLDDELPEGKRISIADFSNHKKSDDECEWWFE
jgi:hypothetical protein